MRLVHVVVLNLHGPSHDEFAVALVVHVVAQIAHAQDVRKRAQPVPLVPSEAALEPRPARSLEFEEKMATSRKTRRSRPSWYANTPIPSS